METCKNCLHYDICTFHVTGNENEKCTHYTPTADVVPRSEVERLEHILNSYALQYGTVKDQHEVIEKAKAEVAREIFKEIEKSVASKIPMKIRPIFKDDRDFDAGVVDGKRDAFIEVLVLLAELKKKYAEEKDD